MDCKDIMDLMVPVKIIWTTHIKKVGKYYIARIVIG